MRLCVQHLSCLRRCFCFSSWKFVFWQNINKMKYSRLGTCLSTKNCCPCASLIIWTTLWYGPWIFRYWVHINLYTMLMLATTTITPKWVMSNSCAYQLCQKTYELYWVILLMFYGHRRHFIMRFVRKAKIVWSLIRRNRKVNMKPWHNFLDIIFKIHVHVSSSVNFAKMIWIKRLNFTRFIYLQCSCV